MNARNARTIAAVRIARQKLAIAAMLTVNVSSNYKRLSRSLDQLGRKQLPFAFAKTLNETMKAVGKYTVARTYPRAFDVRNRAFFKASMFTGTAVRRATKTKLRVSARDRFDRGNLSATRDRWNQACTVRAHRYPVTVYQSDAGSQGRTQSVTSSVRGG